MSQNSNLVINIDEMTSLLTVKAGALDDKSITVDQYKYLIERTRNVLCKLISKIEKTSVITKSPNFVERLKKNHEHYIEYSIIIQWKSFFDSLKLSFMNDLNADLFYNIDENLNNIFLKAKVIIQSFENLMCKIIYPTVVESEVYLQNWLSSTKNHLTAFSGNIEKIEKTDLFCYLYVFCININIDLDAYIASATEHESRNRRHHY